MDVRTTTETIEFRGSFRLASQPELMPAGRYTVQVEEETIDGLSFTVWRRSATTITPQDLPAGRLVQSWTVLPAELEAALATDRKQAP